MKKLQFLIFFLAITISTFAENGLPEESTKTNSTNSSVSIKKPVANEDIVINQAMIDKFNKAEYSSDQLSFASLVDDYNFQEIKEISQAYQNGEIEILSEASIKEFAKKNMSSDKWLHLYSEAELSVKEN